MGKKNKESGFELFDSYYQAIYQSRWEKLKIALLSEKENSISIPDLHSPYYLDIASFETANLLPVEMGMNVLDMCAAPGGKTLVLANKLNGNGTLTSNDKSPDRRERLRKVVNQCLGEKKSSIVRITSYDASSWGVYEKNTYDAILLDAPCSSERHVICSEKYLSSWSISRPKRLAIQQYAMLSSALIAVKPNGYILYSTCSINPLENTDVIKKLDKKHHDEIEIIDFNLKDSEKLEYGRIVLPDCSLGKGPMYTCLIKKREL